MLEALWFPQVAVISLGQSLVTSERRGGGCRPVLGADRLVPSKLLSCCGHPLDPGDKIHATEVRAETGH